MSKNLKNPTTFDRFEGIEQRQEAMNKTLAALILRTQNLEFHDEAGKKWGADVETSVTSVGKRVTNLQTDYENFKGEMLRGLLGHHHLPVDKDIRHDWDAHEVESVVEGIEKNLTTYVLKEMQYYKQEQEEIQAALGKLQLAAAKWPAPIGEIQPPISIHDRILYAAVGVVGTLVFLFQAYGG